MHLRYIKILTATIAAFMCLFYVLQNLANLPAAHASLLYVMSGADHAAYPSTFAFHTASGGLAWLAVAIVCGFEILAGFALLFGAVQMWRARAADSATFVASRKWAEIGTGLGILVWFGLFGVIGSAFFQMWQTEIGANSMNGAFQLFASCALTLLILNLRDTS